MKKRIFQFAFLLLTNSVFGQVISDKDIYDCINNGFIPYIKTKKDTTVLISGYIEQTAFNQPYYGRLYIYNNVISYLKDELSFDKRNIKYIKQQILNEDINFKWDPLYVFNAVITDTLKKYEGYHLSIPILSLDKTIFIIIKHWTENPYQGRPRCGSESDGYIPMLFQKINNEWTFLKNF